MKEVKKPKARTAVAPPPRKTTRAKPIVRSGQVSELWQRMRAARAWAGMSQQQLVDAWPQDEAPSRAAVSFWETENENSRTVPSAHQLITYAKVTRVPLEWLGDDSQRPDSIAKVMQETTGLVRSKRNDDVIAGKGERFWNAVRAHVAVEDDSLSSRFGVAVPSQGMPLQAGFLLGYQLVSLASVHGDWRKLIVAEASQLLALEKALGRKHDKHLLVYINDEKVDEDAAMRFAEHLGVSFRAVREMHEATEYLLAL